MSCFRPNEHLMISVSTKKKNKQKQRWACARHRMQWMSNQNNTINWVRNILIKVISTPAVFVHGIFIFAVIAAQNKLKIRSRYWCMSRNEANRVNTAAPSLCDRCFFLATVTHSARTAHNFGLCIKSIDVWIKCAIRRNKFIHNNAHY